jgi:hypothetical protein
VGLTLAKWRGVLRETGSQSRTMGTDNQTMPQHQRAPFNPLE